MRRMREAVNQTKRKLHPEACEGRQSLIWVVRGGVGGQKCIGRLYGIVGYIFSLEHLRIVAYKFVAYKII